MINTISDNNSIQLNAQLNTPKIKMIIQEVPHTIIHESMFKAFAIVIKIGQVSGIMPLYGLQSKDYNGLEFKTKSIKFVFAMFVILGSLLSLLFCIINMVIIGVLIDKAGGLIFYIATTLTFLKFLHIAQNWKTLMKEWTQVEMAMRRYPQVKLRKRFKIHSAVLLLLALLEHILFVGNNINTTSECTDIEDSYARIYFTVAFPHFFRHIEFSILRAIIVQVINMISTFAWNYCDLFIMLISSALALRFRAINNKFKKTNLHDIIWQDIREDYNRVIMLNITVDKYLSGLVTISFISNVLFICIQLYNSFKPRYGIFQSVYFFYSFGYMLLRTLSLILYTAWVIDESRLILNHLNAVPSKEYNIEITRLIQQIQTQQAGISGSRLFYVTRSLLLQIGGTIITFELMLLQFGPILENSSKENTHNICSKY